VRHEGFVPMMKARLWEASAVPADACPALVGILENSLIDIAKISRIEGRVHPEDQAIRPSPITSQPK
jgi:hypothetical protein